MATRLKKEFIRLLERDEEFRYTVAGYLGLADISKSLARLAEAQARTEERVTRLEEAVTRLAEAQARTEERVARVEVSLRELAQQVGKLSDTIGFGLEDIARVVLPGWLNRHEGIEVDGEVVEINLYGVGVRGDEKVAVLGEARSRIYEHNVKEFDGVAEKAGELYRTGFTSSFSATGYTPRRRERLQAEA